MKVDDLVKTVLCSEDSCVAYLRSFGLLCARSQPCTKPECHGTMKESKREKRFFLRCGIKKCRKTCSIRSANKFFHFTDSGGRPNCKMSMCDIVRLAYFFTTSTSTIKQLSTICGNGTRTVCTWLNLFRKVCTLTMDDAPKLVGTHENPVQIDEAFFGGRAKYNRGRRLKGDRRPPGEASAHNELLSEINAAPESTIEGRVKGPWVFGLYQEKDKVRFVVVPDRKASTLIPIIQQYVQEGSVIVSDEWAAYRRLSEHGFTHHTVCHRRNYVDPESGFHTQAIERAWADAKVYIKRARGSGPLLQSHLDELMWRKANDGIDYPAKLFEVFWKDVKKVFQ